MNSSDSNANSFQICDAQFDQVLKYPDLLVTMDDVPREKDLTQLANGIADFRSLTAQTILHEV